MSPYHCTMSVPIDLLPNPPPLPTPCRDYALPGDYRSLVLKPENVQWSVCPHPSSLHHSLCSSVSCRRSFDYDDIMQPLILSDLDTLEAKPAPVSLPGDYCPASLGPAPFFCRASITSSPPHARWAVQGSECGVLSPALFLRHHGHQGGAQDGHLVTPPGSAGHLIITTHLTGWQCYLTISGFLLLMCFLN